jgi:hypothetical protein
MNDIFIARINIYSKYHKFISKENEISSYIFNNNFIENYVNLINFCIINYFLNHF